MFVVAEMAPHVLHRPAICSLILFHWPAICSLLLQSFHLPLQQRQRLIQSNTFARSVFPGCLGLRWTMLQHHHYFQLRPFQNFIINSTNGIQMFSRRQLFHWTLPPLLNGQATRLCNHAHFFCYQILTFHKRLKNMHWHYLATGHRNNIKSSFINGCELPSSALLHLVTLSY